MSEIHSVFPDPAGQPKTPPTAEQLINRAIIDVMDNATWEYRDGGYYCHLCAPGGYRIREGASPHMHEEQRNPDTHRRNVIWTTVQWFKVQGLPVPTWPDCYRELRDGRLWCHICRTACGFYGREDAEKHDLLHKSLKRIVMQPGRLLPKRGRRGEGKRQPHALDVMLGVQDDAQPTHASFGDIVHEPRKPPTDSERWIISEYRGTDKVLVPLDAPDPDTGHMFKQMTRDELDAPLSIGDVTWRVACDMGQHYRPGAKEQLPTVCSGLPVCQCECHDEFGESDHSAPEQTQGEL